LTSFERSLKYLLEVKITLDGKPSELDGNNVLIYVDQRKEGLSLLRDTMV